MWQSIFLYESGTMDAVPEELRDYIDFEGYGNNLYTSGTFIERITVFMKSAGNDN